MWQPFEYAAKSKIIFGKNSLERLGEVVESFSVKRVVIVTDQGIIDAGHAQKAIDHLTQKNITTFTKLSMLHLQQCPTQTLPLHNHSFRLELIGPIYSLPI